MTTEKQIESYLVKRCKEQGWTALKYYNPNATGYPDRLVLLPGARVLWVEVKRPGAYPTALQIVRMQDLCDFGHEATVVSSFDDVDHLIVLIKSAGISDERLIIKKGFLSHKSRKSKK